MNGRSNAPFALSDDAAPPPPGANKFRHPASEVKSLLYGGEAAPPEGHHMGKKMLTRGNTEAPFATNVVDEDNNPYAGRPQQYMRRPGDMGNKFAVGAAKVGAIDTDASRVAYLGSRTAADNHRARNYGSGNILSHVNGVPQ